MQYIKISLTFPKALLRIHMYIEYVCIDTWCLYIYYIYILYAYTHRWMEVNDSESSQNVKGY